MEVPSKDIKIAVQTRNGRSCRLESLGIFSLVTKRKALVGAVNSGVKYQLHSQY